MSPKVRHKVEEEEEYAPDPEEEEEAPSGPVDLEEGETGDASLEEILTKKPEERPAPEEEEEDDTMLAIGRDDPVETLAVKVVPPDPAKEFTCRNCHLVKLRSQLADKKRMSCRDCA